MSTPVDIRQLAVRRDAPTLSPGRPRHLLTRYLLPGAVVAGFAALVAWSARDSFLPSKPVTVLPVATKKGTAQQEGTPLFQAAGWVEPRPTPVLVTSLAEGVIDQLLVVEGQEVKAGQPVALLIDADAKLALQGALAELRTKEADADFLLAKVEADLLFLPFQLQAAESKQHLAAKELEAMKQTPGSIPAIRIVQAESNLTTTTAAVEELRLRKKRLEREAGSLKHYRSATPAELAKATDGLTEAEANMKAAMTRAWLAQVAVETAKLRLERMTVRAPTDARVLGLLARPGMRLMGLAPGSLHDSSTIVSLYNPKSLQVRADVRFDDLPGVVPGQAARIESPAAARPIDGVVLFVTSLANLQKNTLEVKIEIKDPPPVLKPDMLVTVTFLAPKRADEVAEATEQLRVLIPRPLVEAGEGGPRVWLADQANRKARSRPVKLGRPDGDLVEVVHGLTPADKLIVGGREALADGDRITVTGEDTSLGTTNLGGSRAKDDGGHKAKH